MLRCHEINYKRQAETIVYIPCELHEIISRWEMYNKIRIWEKYAWMVICSHYVKLNVSLSRWQQYLCRVSDSVIKKNDCHWEKLWWPFITQNRQRVCQDAFVTSLQCGYKILSSSQKNRHTLSIFKLIVSVRIPNGVLAVIANYLEQSNPFINNPSKILSM